jgi:1A family penicillin-binding protein
VNLNKDKLLHFFKVDPRDLFIGVSAVVSFVLFVSLFTYVYFARDLQSKEGVMNRNDTGLVLVDRHDKPFFTFYQGHYKDVVPLSEIPKVTQQAVIIEEDKDFYSHAGFSIKAIAGALIADIKHQELAYGGSTITQQLVKNVLLNSSKSFLRKYQELILAQELERRYTKDEILEMYLNSVYLGNGAFGVSEAAQVYFGKEVKDLDLAESAMIAALLPAPSDLSPVGGDLDRARARQNFVLQNMYEDKRITKEELTKAQNKELSFSGDSLVSYEAAHFALLVKKQLIEKYGEEKVARSGFKVKTTLDLDKQIYAEQQVKSGVDRLKGNIVSNGAAVALDPKTGEVLVMVGSKDWNDDKFGKFNIAEATRQPGSSFKPIVYAAALEEKLITPATQLHDSPTTFNNCPGATTEQLKDPRCRYAPKNYDGKTRGMVTTRRALSNSLNIPAVEVMSKVGVNNALEMAHRLGITTLNEDPSNFGLSLVLGAGEVRLVDLAAVYSVFAAGGQKTAPSTILEIRDKKGETIYHYQPKSERVLDEGVAFLISSILSDNSSRAEMFGNALTINRVAAVKTGTTVNYNDAWTLGYTPSLVVGVWVGNNDGTPMDTVAGSLGPAPIWRNLMQHFLEGTKAEAFVPPGSVITSTGCAVLASSKEATVSATIKEYFLAGTETKVTCPKPTPSPSTSPSPQSSPTSTPETQGVSVEQSGGNKNDVNIINGTPRPGSKKKEEH